MAPARSIPPAAESPEPASAQHRILDAARTHLFSYGYNALTMDDLAHELGMSKKTLYLHFPGKDAIIGTIIDEIGRKVREELEAILNQPKLSFPQRLRAIVDVVGLDPRVRIAHSEAANDRLTINGLGGNDRFFVGASLGALIQLTVNQ